MVLMRLRGLCGYVRYDEVIDAGAVMGDDTGGRGGCSVACRARLAYWQPEEIINISIDFYQISGLSIDSIDRYVSNQLLVRGRTYIISIVCAILKHKRLAYKFN